MPIDATRTTTSIRAAYLDAASSAAALLAEPAVAKAWTEPSALAKFQLSGLAGHLASQILAVPRVLDTPVPDEEPATLLGHYDRGAWIDVDVDDEVNVGIRHSGEQTAAAGAAELARQVQATVANLGAALAAEPADRVVHLSGRWSLRLDDFLITRMMEIAVHSDDLAVSVGVAAPELPDDVVGPVLELLVQLAVRRHGSAALLRAFSRAERAPGTVAAF
ncbi:MAG TPA: maleylpyruvate isomerase N-terminal domain-containing protein [Nocardioidaceae bacterium]|jgi:hypothetical protein|nr:maleylpyruvate isomerase N-terminal domain-containing protein [Nocardioidaceae bacterium]